MFAVVLHFLLGLLLLHILACSQGSRGRKRGKEGVSGPAEDLRPASEAQAGVNFRPAGSVRRQVAGHFLVGNQAQVIRQSLGWTKVCGTAQSGIWVLKGNARTCMLPENLDYLRVGWRPRGA